MIITTISPEEQKRRESKAVTKESQASQKASEAFSHLTNANSDSSSKDK
jgi:hypothetical protein